MHIQYPTAVIFAFPRIMVARLTAHDTLVQVCDLCCLLQSFHGAPNAEKLMVTLLSAVLVPLRPISSVKL